MCLTFDKKPRRIGVIGGEDSSLEIRSLAKDVGKEIGKRGFILVCGGLAGVMESACSGAKEAGGITIGILSDKSASGANPFVDIPIVTGIGYVRNMIVVLSSEVIIAIGGRHGTLSEIAYGFTFKIPIIGLSTWDIEGIIPAKTPEEAVSLAVSLLK